MDCRRAFEIELGAFLRDPRRPEWDEFRAHYPRCAACAAEVRAHTEVALLLAPAHPDPERLLLLEDEPAALDPAERARLTHHVAGCVTCRDELAALRRFAPAPALMATAAAAPRRAAPTPLRVVEASPRSARPRRRPLARIGRLLWQPGVAWAAVLVLAMYSTLGPGTRRLVERTTPPSAEQRAPAVGRASPAAPAPSGTAPPPATPAAAPPPVLEQPAVPAPPAARPKSVESPTPPAPAKRARAEEPRASDAAKTPSDERAVEPRTDEAPSSEQRFAREGRLSRQARPEPADEADVAESLGGLADGVEKEDGAASPPPPPAPALEAKGKPSALAASRRPDVEAEAPISTATLVPTADGLARLELVVPSLPSEVDVELRTSDGRRRLTERVGRSAPGGSSMGTLSISLPADWLGAGPYDVEVRDPSGRLLYTTRVEARR